MFTGKNEFKDQILSSVINTVLELTDYDIDTEIGCYTGRNNNTDIKIYCSYYDDLDYHLNESVENLLEFDMVKIYFDDECVLWVK